jgi:hypothetical protein
MSRGGAPRILPEGSSVLTGGQVRLIYPGRVPGPGQPPGPCLGPGLGRALDPCHGQSLGRGPGSHPGRAGFRRRMAPNLYLFRLPLPEGLFHFLLAFE